MKKIAFVLVLIMLLLPATVYAASFHDLPVRTSMNFGTVRIEPLILEGERVGGVTLHGIVPEVTGSEALSEAINHIINMRTNGGIGTVELSYNIVSSMNTERFASIIFVTEVTSIGGARTSSVDTLNFDKFTFELVYAQMPDLLGSNGLAIATDVVNNFIAQNFRHMPRISSLGYDAPFYFKNDAVYFVFARYEIAPGSEGIQSVPVQRGNLWTHFLEFGDYHIDFENHGVRMLPLRRIAEAFGYGVGWNEETLQIEVIRKNGSGSGANGSATLRINQNAYTRAQETIPRTLEAAPMIRYGITYVPISFFEIILGIHYNISIDGTIELTTYRHNYW